MRLEHSKLTQELLASHGEAHDLKFKLASANVKISELEAALSEAAFASPVSLVLKCLLAPPVLIMMEGL